MSSSQIYQIFHTSKKFVTRVLAIFAGFWPVDNHTEGRHRTGPGKKLFILSMFCKTFRVQNEHKFELIFSFPFLFCNSDKRMKPKLANIILCTCMSVLRTYLQDLEEAPVRLKSNVLATY